MAARDGSATTEARGGVVEASAAGFLQLFSASIVARAVTFASNVVIARQVGRAVLGIGTLQLEELLFLGPLVMTRDGLRKVASRGQESGPGTAQSLVNLCWVTAPVAFLLGLFAARSLWLNQADPDARFVRALLWTLAALALSVLHEPAFVLVQSRMDQRFRARSETAAVLFKCLVMTVGTVGFGIGLEAFAFGNVAYAGMLCALYLWDFYQHNHDGVSLVPRRTSKGEFWNDSTFGATKEFWVQSVQKWVLENGEKIAMVFLGTQEQAGEYALVSNLGSIVARLLFQPLEEMALALFGRLQQKVLAPDASAKQKAAPCQALSVLTRLLVLLGLVFACFGPAYAHLLLHLLYGPTWSNTTAPQVLAWYCTYILVMAVNGIFEAFVQGIATPQQLRTYNYWMLLFSICFLGAVVVLMPYGAVGIVGANIMKMVCRISVCAFFYMKPVFDRISPGSMSRILPPMQVCGSFALAAVLTQASLTYVYQPSSALGFWFSAAKHVLLGLLCLTVLGLMAWRQQGRQLLRDMRELRLS